MPKHKGFDYEKGVGLHGGVHLTHGDLSLYFPKVARTLLRRFFTSARRRFSRSFISCLRWVAIVHVWQPSPALGVSLYRIWYCRPHHVVRNLWTSHRGPSAVSWSACAPCGQHDCFQARAHHIAFSLSLSKPHAVDGSAHLLA